MKETILGVFQGFYNNIDLYNLLKKASDKLKVKFIGKLERMFKEKFLPLEYDHKRVWYYKEIVYFSRVNLFDFVHSTILKGDERDVLISKGEHGSDWA